jgi:CheY-like chemotaxis protein
VSRAGILVVEDDADIRNSLADFLRRQGYGVETAANGRDALEALERPGVAIDLVLLDLMMPVMSGEEFLEEAGQRGLLAPAAGGAKNSASPGCPRVIVLTATGAVAPAVGAHRILRKPFKLRELLEAVVELSPPPGR